MRNPLLRIVSIALLSVSAVGLGLAAAKNSGEAPINVSRKDVDEMLVANSAAVDHRGGNLSVCGVGNDELANYFSIPFSKLGSIVLLSRVDPQARFSRTLILEENGLPQFHVLVYISEKSGTEWFNKTFQAKDIGSAANELKKDVDRCLSGGTLTKTRPPTRPTNASR